MGATWILLASATPHTPLRGTWEDSDDGVRGEIVVSIISITQDDPPSVRGTIKLGGSEKCKDPIPFIGTFSGKKLTATSDAPEVCGYSGKLLVEVVEGEDALYTGTFSYVLGGLVHARGKFRLGPEKK